MSCPRNSFMKFFLKTLSGGVMVIASLSCPGNRHLLTLRRQLYGLTLDFYAKALIIVRRNEYAVMLQTFHNVFHNLTPICGKVFFLCQLLLMHTFFSFRFQGCNLPKTLFRNLKTFTETGSKIREKAVFVAFQPCHFAIYYKLHPRFFG